jgi:methylase of polypeptide subunit release factors
MSRLLHRYLFGYSPCQGSEVYGSYWDWTTLILRKALRQRLNRDGSLLDMGTGSVGVLAIYAGLCLGCRRILAVDYVPEIVLSAKKNADSLGLNIVFRCSDLFETISGRFETIVFNAPYLDITMGQNLGILKTPLSIRRFSGGQSGRETIERFLCSAPDHLLGDGVLMLGVNHYHVSEVAIQDLVLGSGLALRYRVTNPLTRASAYVLNCP